MTALRLIFIALLAMTSSACSYMGFTDFSPEEVEARYGNEHSQFFYFNGTRVHFRDEGRRDEGAPAVIMLHGVMASLHTWDGWEKELKNDFRLIRLDIPGFGLTGPSAQRQYNVEMSTALIDALAKHLNVQRFSLVGNSMGGYIAWNYAATYPKKVQSMILVDSAGYPMEVPFVLKIMQVPILKNIVPYITPRFIVSYTLNDVYGDKSKVTDATIDRYHMLMLRKGNRNAVIDVISEIKNMSPEKVTQVQAPTLIMWGERDTWIPTVNAENFHRDIKGSELIMYPGAGHVPMEEIPVKTAMDARRFLLAHQHKNADDNVRDRVGTQPAME